MVEVKISLSFSTYFSTFGVYVADVPAVSFSFVMENSRIQIQISLIGQSTSVHVTRIQQNPPN